jgi:hypothetical protein
LHHWQVSLKLTQAARKHWVVQPGSPLASATIEPTVGTRPSGEPQFSWAGPDDRGRDLEIIGVLVDIDGEPAMLIIHAMPTALRRK